MEFSFYFCGLVAVLTTLRVITHTNPVHALLFLIISLLSVSGVFFSLGAYFAGVLEVIVYAGAIMVLFVFVMMLLNLGKATEKQEQEWFHPSLWIGPGLICFFLLVVVIYAIITAHDHEINGNIIDAKAVGISLFGPYVLTVELSSMLLLAGLVVAFHIGRVDRQGQGEVITKNRVNDAAQKKEKA